MRKIILYKYDNRYRKEMSDIIENQNSLLISCMFKTNEEGNNTLYIPKSESDTLYIDLTSLFQKGEHVFWAIGVIDELFNVKIEQVDSKLYFIIDQQYVEEIYKSLYYRIEDVKDLLALLSVKKEYKSKSVVEINEDEFEDMFLLLQKELFGNSKFKLRLHEELKKFRLFNCTGIHPIFSTLIFGDSGIGKTEVARIFHKFLSADEPMIKINFGNYSSRDALNSLIGSPRGYIGSETGELTSKLQHSQSKVILIDEFEKADKQVHNFFLQLLEEGKFTDSMGNEYDLSQYIIFFTTNANSKQVKQYFSPELLSRFNYKVHFSLLSSEEKKQYVKFKINQITNKLRNTYPTLMDGIDIEKLVCIDERKYCNLREINNEIMKQISNNLYEKLIDIKSRMNESES